MNNLFDRIPDDLPAEWMETLAESGSVRIERIVSRGHASPPGEWYDQALSEWVLLLKGSAGLEFEDGREAQLYPGDWLEIPAHQRHRVAWTDPGEDTVWLAVHYPP